MEITTKYEIGQHIWAIEEYPVGRKECSECGTYHSRIIRYRVSKPRKISKISIAKYVRGNVLSYEAYGLIGKLQFENSINREGGVWFTTPEAAQAECNRRNDEIRKRGRTGE
jgi:hypothetical protein